MEYKKDVLIKLYEKMYLDRRLEQRMQQIYKEGDKIIASLHLGIGHEGLSVGATAPLTKDDYLVFSHRGMGHCLTKGMPARRLLAEWYGKSTGCSRGKGGVHLSDFSRGILGISGSQGGNAVIAVGAALSSKIKNQNRVAMCFFGEGTANRGPIHEGMNMAAVWDLPVVFICENDEYSFSTHQSKVLPVEDVAERAKAYDMPGKVVDGNNVLEVYDEVNKAVKRARNGGGPSLIEGKTHRWGGHHEKDDYFNYLEEEEIKQWKNECPLKRYTRYLVEQGIEKEELKNIRQRIEKEIAEAVEFAENSSFPEAEELYTGVYADPQNAVVREEW